MGTAAKKITLEDYINFFIFLLILRLFCFKPHAYHIHSLMERKSVKETLSQTLGIFPKGINLKRVFFLSSIYVRFINVMPCRCYWMALCGAWIL